MNYKALTAAASAILIGAGCIGIMGADSAKWVSFISCGIIFGFWTLDCIVNGDKR